MDSGSFYSRSGSVMSSQGVGLGYEPVPRPPYIRDELPSTSHDRNYYFEVGLGQKIDQVVSLVREQAKETAIIKEELFSLRADVTELQCTSKTLSESVSSTPSPESGSTSSSKKSKIPTQLSVSIFAIHRRWYSFLLQTLVKILHEHTDTTKQFVGSEP